MPGPPRTPTHLQILRGNPGKRRVNEREPRPNQAVPKCPRWLDATARRAWRELGAVLDEMRVITLADAMALELLCTAYADYRAASAAIARHGMTYACETEFSTIIRIRPEVLQAANAWRRVKVMLQEFGLTPASRSKVSADTIPDDPLEEFLQRGRTAPPPRGRRKGADAPHRD